MIGIYKITSPTKKVYIGQSIDIKKRFAQYNCNSCKGQPKLYRSLIKHGFINHKFEVVTECDEADLNKWERYYQDLYSACGKSGLNCAFTGYNDRSGRVTEETKEKIRSTLTGFKRSDEFRKAVSKRMMGLKRTPEQNKAHSERMKGRPIWNKGIPMSEESKAKMIASKEGLNTGELSHNNKIVFDTATGVYYFNSRDAAEFNNISYKLLSRYLTGSRRNKTSLIYA